MRSKVREYLEDAERIKEYPSGEYSTSSELSEDEAKKVIKLDANENLFIPKNFLSQISREVAEELDPRLYPQSEKRELINALSDYLSLTPECFAVGNGSDELIETFVTAFLRSGERAISITPTFSMYEIIVKTHVRTYDSVPLGDDFALDTDALLSKVTPATALCILCSPNNPTGNQFEPGSVRKILEEFNGIVIVDEAYNEFAPTSIKEAIKDFDNLIVLRSFSKTFGLAGLRIGYSIACPKITSMLRKIQLPWNINKFSMLMAIKVLEKKELFLDLIEGVKTERTRLFNKLNMVSGIKAFKSDANFILFTPKMDADTVFNQLRSKGIFIRNLGFISGFNKFLRVTVGLPEMNDLFIDAVEEIFDG